jgi:hypothetical protein
MESIPPRFTYVYVYVYVYVQCNGQIYCTFEHIIDFTLKTFRTFYLEHSTMIAPRYQRPSNNSTIYPSQLSRK